ncbi:MAG: YhfC family intramembrane metalloprotease [Chloroflexi bacterium]|nr:YhfC family intramembrane metalloprotease [Chloroflexota bacterium]
MAIFVRILNPVLMLVMPLVLGVYLARRLKGEWRIFGIGVVTFIGSQVLHIPFNLWVLSPFLEKMGWNGVQSGISLAFTAMLLGLSAGVFEEAARYIVFRTWLKEKRDWCSALMFGAGHGGVEAIIVGILALATLIQIMTLRGADLSAVVPADQIELARAQIEAFWALPGYAVLLGALERASAISLHLGATVLVLQAFRRKQIRWLFAAIAWHAALDAVAVYGIQTWGMYITEALILLMAVISLVFVFKLRDPCEQRFDTIDPPQQVQVGPLPSVVLDERLDESRYT